MSNDIIIKTAVDINNEYMLHLHRELWRLHEILEKHKIAYEESVWVVQAFCGMGGMGERDCLLMGMGGWVVQAFCGMGGLFIDGYGWSCC